MHHAPIVYCVQAAQRFQMKAGTRIEALQKTLCKYEVYRRRWEGESPSVGASMGFTVSGDRLPFFIQMKQMQVHNSLDMDLLSCEMQPRVITSSLWGLHLLLSAFLVLCT